jgi:hypothetical protein
MAEESSIEALRVESVLAEEGLVEAPEKLVRGLRGTFASRS